MKKSKKNTEKLTMTLYRAAQAYVEYYGGTALVAGGVSTIQLPGDLEYNYLLAVRLTGRKPVFEVKS